MHGAGLVGGSGRALALASARTGAREKVQGHREVLGGFVARRNSNGLFSQIGKFFPIAPVDFQSIGGRGGGRVRNFFRNFFFFASFGGGEGGGGPRTPEARVARFLVGMFRNRFFEAGVDAKGSPRVATVSPRGGGGRKSVTFIFLTVDFCPRLGWPEREEKRRKEETTATTAAEET